MSVTPCDFLSRAIGIEGSLGDLLNSGFPFTAFMNPAARKGGWDFSPVLLRGNRESSKLKGLILAQNERWRRGLGMQVVGGYVA